MPEPGDLLQVGPLVACHGITVFLRWLATLAFTATPGYKPRPLACRGLALGTVLRMAGWRWKAALGEDWSSRRRNGRGYQLCPYGCLPTAAILDDPMECSRGERLSITLAKNRITRAPERLGKAKVEVDIFELLRDSEYETAETST